MMNARIGLILTGLAFGIWEAVDIFWIDVPADGRRLRGPVPWLHALVLAPRQRPGGSGADGAVRLRGRGGSCAEARDDA